jgi:hypothetical protein
MKSIRELLTVVDAYGQTLSEGPVYDMLIKNGATPVIYIGYKDEISKRLGLVISLVKSVFSGSVLIQSAIIDLVSFVEISDHSYEYEYRIANKNLIEGGQFERLELPVSAIQEIFIPNESERVEIEKSIALKLMKEGSSDSLPPISLSNSIILSESEIYEIEKIKSR